ncbi:MAG: glycosyltransferase family 4 protein [Candidatus Omnitrophota bacterium]
MKICMIAKYPPIEGGESSKAYWLARGLGRRGHEVHVVTNAWEVEEEYREQLSDYDLKYKYQPPGVYVHNTSSTEEMRHIPYSKSYIAKLAGLAIDVIRKFDLQVIDSRYILPYAVSGFLAKDATGKPQIMHHAVSDINRLLKIPHLRTLFVSIFNRVDKIVTFPGAEKQFLNSGVSKSKLSYNKISIDTEAFNPKVKALDLSEYGNRNFGELPVITYAGKMGANKGVYELIKAARGVRKDFLLLFVTGGRGTEKFKQQILRLKLKQKAIFINFLPPWKIPSVIKRSACVVLLERGFPHSHHVPLLAREAMSVGKCLLLSNELYNKKCFWYIFSGINAVVTDPKKTSTLTGVLNKIIEEPSFAERIGRNARVISNRIEKFNEYVDNTVRLYEEVLQKYKRR